MMRAQVISRSQVAAARLVVAAAKYQGTEHLLSPTTVRLSRIALDYLPENDMPPEGNALDQPIATTRGGSSTRRTKAAAPIGGPHSSAAQGRNNPFRHWVRTHRRAEVNPGIDFQGVTKVYAGTARPALQGLNFNITSGEFVVLLGAPGSGKSTLLRLLMGEDRATAGRLYVQGQDLTRRHAIQKWRRSIGVVYSDFRLLPDRSVFANVAFPMQVLGRNRKQIRDDVFQVLRLAGLEDVAHRMPHELSLGESQLLSVARAIVNRPSVLLADEPFKNLDSHAALVVSALLEKINAAGTTVVLAAPDLDRINPAGKRIIELRLGEVVKDNVVLEGVASGDVLPEARLSPSRPTKSRSPGSP